MTHHTSFPNRSFLLLPPGMGAAPLAFFWYTEVCVSTHIDNIALDYSRGKDQFWQFKKYVGAFNTISIYEEYFKCVYHCVYHLHSGN